MTNPEFAVIGMSPGNSYFTDIRIKKLIEAVASKYIKVAIFVADVPAIATYKALGYSENRARRDKAIPKGNNLKNKSIKAINELALSDRFKIVDWDNEVANDPKYKQNYSNILQFYNSNQDFAKAADDATKEVLENSSKSIADINSAIKTAVTYLLEELAFMEFAPQHFNANKLVYIYHKSWPVYQDYIAGKYDGRKRDYLDFEIIAFS